MLRQLLDHAAFLVCSRLSDSACRHLCSIDCHDHELIDTAQYTNGTFIVVACTRPGCLITDTIPVEAVTGG